SSTTAPAAAAAAAGRRSKRADRARPTAPPIGAPVARQGRGPKPRRGTRGRTRPAPLSFAASLRARELRPAGAGGRGGCGDSVLVSRAAPAHAAPPPPPAAPP